VAPPLPLAVNADVAQLTQWLTEWSLLYHFSGDQPIQEVLWPSTKNFGPNELRIIFNWKLDNPWRAAAPAQITDYAAAHPGDIEHKTGNALAALDDREALGGWCRTGFS
jgi:hypothetical protein